MLCRGAASRARRHRLGRGGDERDVAAKALLVLVAAIGQLDPEVVTRPVSRVAVDGEEDEQRSLGDLPLLGDRRFHAESSRRKRRARRTRSPRPAVVGCASTPRSARTSACPRPASARSPLRGRRRSTELDLRTQHRPVGVPGLELVRQPDTARIQQPSLPHAPVVLHVRVRGDDARLGDPRRELLDPLGGCGHSHAFLVAAGGAVAEERRPEPLDVHGDCARVLCT